MLLSIKNLSLKYETKNREFYIFKNVNYSFDRCELVSVIGESGKGKTSLLNILASYNDDYEGEIKYSCEKHEIAFVFQNLNLVTHLNVIENVMLPLLLFNVTYKKSYELSKEALKRVGLENYESRKIDELSGGQRARIGLARALSLSSKIILADEPTGSLDSSTSDEIMLLLKDLSKDHLVIVVTHNEKLAFKYSSKVLMIQNYKLVEAKNEKVKCGNLIDEEVKVKKVSLFTSLKLAWSFMREKIVKISLASFFSSFCFALVLMIFSLTSNGGKELIDIGKEYYNYNVINISKKKEIPLENTSLKISRNVRLDNNSILDIKMKYDGSFMSYPSLNMFIYPVNNYYFNNRLSDSKVSFMPSFKNENIERGRMFNSYSEVICNSLFLKEEKLKLNDVIRIKNDIKVTTKFKEETKVDLLHLDIPLKIVGVSKEKEILNRKTIYYDYLNMNEYILDLNLEEASSFLDRTFKLEERITKYTYEFDTLLDSKSVCVCDDPLKLKSKIENDNFILESQALEMTNAMINLIDSFSKIILIFIILALVCAFFLEYVFIENLYGEKKKELALYLSFHISKKSFFRLGNGQAYIFSILKIVLSIIFFVSFSLLGNKILNLYNLPSLFSYSLKLKYIIFLLILIVTFSYFCCQLPLHKIYKTNLIDSLRGE